MSPFLEYELQLFFPRFAISLDLKKTAMHKLLFIWHWNDQSFLLWVLYFEGSDLIGHSHARIIKEFFHIFYLVCLYLNVWFIWNSFWCKVWVIWIQLHFWVAIQLSQYHLLDCSFLLHWLELPALSNTNFLHVLEAVDFLFCSFGFFQC